MRISLVHQHRVTREVLGRTLALRLNATVIDFSNIEDMLKSSMDYDVFVLYNYFGRDKMERWQGIKWIRAVKPHALIISMIHNRFFERRAAPPGGDAVILRVGDEIEGLVQLIREQPMGKSYILISGTMDDHGP
jgi:hypothetical protein